MSDYNIFIRERSKVFLGGPPLVKMATGEDSNDEELGGAEMHATMSGSADYLAEDETDALRAAGRGAHLNWQAGARSDYAGRRARIRPGGTPGPAAGRSAKPRRHPRRIARVVDGSRFEEFKPLWPHTGHRLGVGPRVPVGSSATTASSSRRNPRRQPQFIQLCNQIDVPIIFLQNITGYMVGKVYEQGGIVKNGSKMINAVSNSKVPHITVIIGASYGAGNYGMSGKAYDTRFTFTWPRRRSP